MKRKRYGNYYRVKKTDMVFVVAAIFLAGIVFASITLPTQQQNDVLSQVSLEGEKSVELQIPAVNVDGTGVTGSLIATVRPGNGKVLVNINNVLAQFDTQISARTAAIAASRYTKLNTSNLDIIYTIKVDAAAIEGPSAGASMAVATVLALQNQQPVSGIVMTGSISNDGTIGRVGSIFEKAKAAKDVGATKFLVPAGQSTSNQQTRTRNCSSVSGIRYCHINYENNPVNIGEELEIIVKEVPSLTEAVREYTIDSVS